MTTRPQDIADRIDCWKRAYDAVLAELETAPADARPFRMTETEMLDLKVRQIELAARTAATLAIGATTRGRGE